MFFWIPFTYKEKCKTIQSRFDLFLSIYVCVCKVLNPHRTSVRTMAQAKAVGRIYAVSAEGTLESMKNHCTP